jgi:uncharacterized protein YecT (DUF1311 family)
MKIFLFLVAISTLMFASSENVQQEYEKNKVQLQKSYKKAYNVMENTNARGDKFKLLHDTWYRYENQNCHFLEKLLKEDGRYKKCMNKAMQERIKKYNEWVDF